MKNFEEFLNEQVINEGIFSFVGKMFSRLGKYIKKPLGDFFKDISKKDDPKAILNSLKEYGTVNIKNMDNDLNNIKNVNSLKDYIKNQLVGISTAISGIKDMQKINNSFFDEIFKDAGRDLSKAMFSFKLKGDSRSKDVETKLGKYVDDILYLQLKKIAGIKNSNESIYIDMIYQGYKLVLENDDSDNSNSSDDSDDDSGEIGDNLNNDQFNKIKEVAKKWIMKIFKPIIDHSSSYSGGNNNNNNNNNSSDNSKVNTNDGHSVDNDGLKKIANNLSGQDLIDFRNKAGLSKDEVPIHTSK